VDKIVLAPKDKFFVGVPKGKTIVIEDVTTTGGSLIETLNGLKEAIEKEFEEFRVEKIKLENYVD
jgi:orotate phosphoribosyltransferase-like protein